MTSLVLPHAIRGPYVSKAGPCCRTPNVQSHTCPCRDRIAFVTIVRIEKTQTFVNPQVSPNGVWIKHGGG
ncbi:pyrimidine reductase, riboflavin biosynthesis [Anopheles sinensis]|uniref:Pyrimidine reductase, riboflavin biosynthesis n=1 Tax=Anopheles sinensis TaxID=74873 RepID=A0A084W8Z0_ANOSI|nr:pyrimidine reductase, riboflavin biosynthesis [Anopheles sinensis]